VVSVGWGVWPGDPVDMSTTTSSSPISFTRVSTSAPLGDRPLRRLVPRGRMRTVVWLALGVAAATVLLPQAGTLAASLRSLAAVQPGWLALGLAVVAARYAMAAVSLQVAVTQPIPFGPTLLVQLASAFVGRLTPEGVGWLVLNQRFLERAGLERASAIAGITLKVVVGGLTRMLIAILVAVAAGTGGRWWTHLPAESALLLAAAALVGATAVGVVAIARPRMPRRLTPLATGLRDVSVVLRQPRRAAALLGSTAALTLTSGLILWASIRAVGGDVAVVDLFVVYLGGTAIAALSPTPGNLGAVELALTAGLTALGMPSATAVAAVLLYRLLTFWLPVVPGFIALRWLQQRALL
jgi:uncharacterized membrane protein YbhN (UPF0104 family)